jgi:hypothetical protein
MKLGGGHARPCHATTVPSLLGCVTFRTRRSLRLGARSRRWWRLWRQCRATWRRFEHDGLHLDGLNECLSAQLMVPAKKTAGEGVSRRCLSSVSPTPGDTLLTPLASHFDRHRLGWVCMTAGVRTHQAAHVGLAGRFRPCHSAEPSTKPGWGGLGENKRQSHRSKLTRSGQVSSTNDRIRSGLVVTMEWSDARAASRRRQCAEGFRRKNYAALLSMAHRLLREQGMMWLHSRTA